MNPNLTLALGAILAAVAVILMVIGGRWLEALALIGAWLGIIGTWKANRQ